MNPIEKSVIEGKAAMILRESELLKKLLSESISDCSDLVLQHALSHAVQNAIAAAIDIAQHILAERGAPLPSSYTESLENLARVGVLENDFAARFARASKLRNVVVHAYTELDINRVVAAVPQLLDDLKTFLKAVDSAVP